MNAPQGNSTPTHKTQGDARLAAGLVVWLQAFLLWTASPDALVSVLVAISVAVPMFTPIRWQPGQKSWAVLQVGLGLFAIFVALMRPPAPIEQASLLVPQGVTLLMADYLLLWQVSHLYRQRREEPLPNYFVSCSLVTMVCTFNQSIVVMQHGMFLLLAIAGAAGCALLLQVSSTNVAANGTRKLAWWASPVQRNVLALVMVGCAAGAWTVSTAWSATVTEVQEQLPGWMSKIGGRVRPPRLYVQSGDLRSITAEKQTDAMNVALRVYADVAPGYLRGRVFDTYYRSQWYSISRQQGKWNRLAGKKFREAVAEPPPGIPASPPGQQLFAIRNSETEGPFVRLEIHNDPQRGELFFSPLTTCYVQGQGSFVAVDDHRAIHGGIATSAPYTTYASRMSVPEELPGGLRAGLLQPMGELDPKIAALAAEVCRTATSSRQKIASVAEFFQSNFSYAEDMEIPHGVEPLSHFLLTRPAAHCEFFASGAVALLRLQGVPCRYVTGYVVRELEQEYDGEYWLARNRNAHAWAEAYDDERKRWVLVEATPGMQPLHQDDEELDFAGVRQQRVVQAADELNGRRRQWLGRIWQAVTGWLQWPLMLLVILLLAATLYYRTIVREHRPLSEADRQVALMQRTRAALDRQLRRRKFIRQPHETLHQFATRLSKAAAQDPWLQQCAEWYRHYANSRYSGGVLEAKIPRR